MQTFFLGNAPEPADRPKIHVSDADASKIRSLPRDPRTTTEVVNLDNGEVLTLRRAECSLPYCFCALAVVPFKSR